MDAALHVARAKYSWQYEAKLARRMGKQRPKPLSASGGPRSRSPIRSASSACLRA